MKKKFEFLCESFYNVSMKRNQVNVERVVSVIGFVFLTVVALLAYFVFDGDKKSIIEKVADSHIVITIIHSLCALIVFITIFKPNINLYITVLIIESNLTIITDFDQLGIFLFYAAILLIYSKDLYSMKNAKMAVFLYCIHNVALILTFPHGWRYTVVAFGYSIFTFAFYIWIYSLFKARFSCYLPKKVIVCESIINKKPGEKISLSDYNLSERHVTFVLENLHNNLSYKELSDKYNVSVSTVKKVFSEVYKIFNVTKLEELRILLLQYQVEK